jgi:hypothetical protein
MLPRIVFTIPESFSVSISGNLREARHKILQNHLQLAHYSMATMSQ